MNNKNHNRNQNPNQGGCQRHKNNDNANSQKAEEAKDENKQVPLKYEMREVKDPTTVELKYTLNNRRIKESMVAYEGKTPEEILKLVREFQNLDQHFGFMAY
jgi:hypothetical protein